VDSPSNLPHFTGPVHRAFLKRRHSSASHGWPRSPGPASRTPRWGVPPWTATLTRPAD